MTEQNTTPKDDHQAPDQKDVPESKDELVDYASEQSFPGSDAPPYYSGKPKPATPKDDDAPSDDKA